MPASIGVNLRVTGHCRQGGRKYMEDFFSVAYQQTEDAKDLEYAFFGIYDGHGGGEAATYAKEHLMESIIRQKNFWSNKDDDVLKAIKDGFITTHYAMWKEQEKWPKTASGLPSTAGTTASVAFIRRGKIYIGHVGDSGIILGFQEPGNSVWKARPLTKDHKPENASEMNRIKQCGGKVITKSGVPRVVWNRPRIGHKGPVRRSTPIDEIPFLAVARSLGDLWSYNSALDEFVVSPDPDTCCIPIDSNTFRCLIFGTDGLWNMITPSMAVGIVQVAEQHNERSILAGNDPQQVQDPSQQTAAGRTTKAWINPSKCLVERALERWSNTRMRADNTTVVTLMLDPPGPPRAEVIKSQKMMQQRAQEQEPYPKNGLEIVTMYAEESSDKNAPTEDTEPIMPNDKLNFQQDLNVPTTSVMLSAEKHQVNYENVQKTSIENSINQNQGDILNESTENSHNKSKISSEVNQISSNENILQEKDKNLKNESEIIQINEVSSSNLLLEEKNAEENVPSCSRCTRSFDAKKAEMALKFLKSTRCNPETPKRKSRSTSKKLVVPTKRGNSELNISRAEMLNNRLITNTSGIFPNALNEPPKKLRRNRSLGPRDFALRSDLKNRRSLRYKNNQNYQKTLLNSFRKVAAINRPFTRVNTMMQTRNKVKRLNNK